jgi:hypothetical protein
MRNRSRRRWYFSRHLGAGVTELTLHMAFIDLGRGGEADAQGMAVTE